MSADFVHQSADFVHQLVTILASADWTHDLKDHLSGGVAFLQGRSVYQKTGFYYPFPIVIIYALLALLPLWLAWSVILVTNLSILVALFKRRALLWMTYTLVLYILMAGQNDLWFLFLERHLKRGTRSAILAALTTLKPQVAILLLPFHLHRWWREDRPTLIRFAAFTATLWSLPSPFWWSEWFWKMRGAPQNLCAPSLWAACGGHLIPLPTVVLAALSLYLVYVALGSGREVTISALQLASPVGFGYETSVLAGMAPPRIMLPLSWVLGLFFLVDPSSALTLFVLLPLVVLVYQKRGTSPEREASRSSGCAG